MDFQSGILISLRDYQLEGAEFLYKKKRALLCDDPGTGKTIQVIAVLRKLYLERKISSVLIVCPASVKQQWANELLKAGDVPAQVSTCVVTKELRKQEGDSVYDHGKLFTIVNYELLWRDAEKIQEQIFDCIILDEIHRIKSFKAKQAKAAKSLRAEYRYGVTGTPIQNDLTDLFSIMQFINKEVLGPWHIFEFNHIVKRRIKDIVYRTKKGKAGRKTLFKTVGYKGQEIVHKKMIPVMIRRRKEDILTQLPKCIENTYKVDMDDMQRRLYNHVKSCGLIENKAVLYKVLNMICDSPVILLESESENIGMILEKYGDHINPSSGKLNELLSILELFPDRRVLLFVL